MTNIFLFGSSTKTGQFIEVNYKSFFEDSQIYSFSRKKSSNSYFDLTSFIIPDNLPLNQEFIIISLAPIWLFVPYLEWLLERKKVNKKLI